MRRVFGLAALPALMVSAAAIPVAHAADTDAVPYWVSLRNSQTNMRVGPGRDYRINWIYGRVGLPLKVLREMGGWVLVEDPDGARGWMLTQFVSRKAHTAIVQGAIIEIHPNNDGSGPIMWRAEPGVIARMIGDCTGQWCKVDIDGRQGFAPAASLWGAAKP
ncbi:SH3 domain-containing protein [Novosphingobium sp.]|uniref:SH3 domain-containing protein n=1 Tax=Novosphingobium sp. TaxID=1874826 RepID=UPI003B52AB31